MFDTFESFENKAKVISRRMFILSVAKAAVFIGIISRLFYLQISENIKYRTLSDKNRLREWKVAPQRGIIEDYYGNKIASNTQVFQLHMMPEDVPNFETLFFKLSRLINFSEQEKINLLVVGGLYNISEVSRLKKICNELSLSEKVHFIGSINRSDLSLYYNSSDICVLPSYYESFGLSALEAAACGVPVVASKKGGLSSIVIDKKTGYLVREGNPADIIEKLSELLENKQKAYDMGKAPPVFLESTHKRTLQFVDFNLLQKFAVN